MLIAEEVSAKIRDIHDFPKPGIIFKDITPVLGDPVLSDKVVTELSSHWSKDEVDAVVGIESRGFLFGREMAGMLQAGFVPVRKPGKLPSVTISESYDLEYGSATLEIHADAIRPGQRVVIHDDLLATGGTAEAAAKLVTRCGGVVVGFSFIVELGFLNGQERLGSLGEIKSILTY